MAFVKIVPPSKERKRLQKADAPVRVSVIKTKSGMRATMMIAPDTFSVLRDSGKHESLRVYVLEGTDQDAGLIKLEPTTSTDAKDGSRIISAVRGGYGKLYLPANYSLLPKEPTKTAKCTIITNSSCGLVVSLPDSWKKSAESPPKEEAAKIVHGDPQNSSPKDIPIRTAAPGLVAKPKAASGFQPKKPPVAKVSRVGAPKPSGEPQQLFNLLGQNVTGALDVIRPIEYLRRKGYTVIRQSDNQWKIKSSEFSAESVSEPWRTIYTADLVSIINEARAKVGVSPITAAHLIDELEPA
jgi:hypothetical protein